MNLVFSILGLLGGVLCAIADILFDLKGKDNNKLGKLGLIDSKWLVMSEWRFQWSILVVMVGVPLYSLGMYSLSYQIGDTIGSLLAIVTLIGGTGGFFIHAFLCLMPIIFKAIPDKELGVTVIDKLFDTIKVPFYLLYLILTLGSTVLVNIAIVNGTLDVPMVCVLLNPIVFLIIGVSLRKIKYDWFCDLPGIVMPSLGLGMFGLIGILNLL